MLRSVTLGQFDKPQVLVLGLFQDDPRDGSAGGLAASLAALKRASYLGAVRAAAAREECSGEAGKIAEAFPVPLGDGAADRPWRVMLVGLGKAGKLTPDAVRTAAAGVARRLAATRERRVMLMLAPALASVGADLAACGRAAGEAFGLLAWDHLAFKGTGSEKDKREKRPAIELDADRKTFRAGLEFGLGLAVSTNLARTLSETPPNIATPAFMAKQAKRLAKEHGLEFTVLEGKDLEKERLVGHIDVGKASVNKPCLVRLEYRPKTARKGRTKPVVLIGKTMCYDTGGLSLKINNGMVGMKRDKDGGCAVLGAMHAVATLIRPSRPVVAYLCAAENSISDEAYRPDDVLTYRNGVTVEITNTDAEGRLVLADGLAYACDKDDPAYIVDLATLTGGVVVALGSTFCGMFCEDDALRQRVERASAQSGERVWRLPMHSEYRDLMKSPIADILNSNANRKAHPIQGAAFLSYFVKDDVPWCHLDIAGVHASESDAGCFVKGPTGWGVRILADLLKGE